MPMWCRPRHRFRRVRVLATRQTGLGARLYTQLSSYYFGFYAVLGLLLPYFSLWLADRGLSASEIGLVLAAHGATRIVLPPLWGALADVSGQRLRIIQLASLGSALGFALLPATSSFAGILGSVLLFSVFWNATMPQFEALTMSRLSQHGGDYSRMRLWGSVGFVLAVVIGGAGFEQAGIEWLPGSIVACILAITAVALCLPGEAQLTAPLNMPSLAAVLRRPMVRALFIACMLHQLSFAPYYGFFSLYLEGHGYGKTAIGLLWAFGVVCEIAIFVWTGALLQRCGARRIFLLALSSTVLRWALLEHTINWLPGLLALQALHMTSFGLYHACAIHYVHREFEGRLQGRGQALHVALSFGLGGAIGAAGGGWIWEAAGPEVAFRGAAVAALAASFIAWRWVR